MGRTKHTRLVVVVAATDWYWVALQTVRFVHVACGAGDDKYCHAGHGSVDVVVEVDVLVEVEVDVLVDVDVTGFVVVVVVVVVVAIVAP